MKSLKLLSTKELVRELKKLTAPLDNDGKISKAIDFSLSLHAKQKDRQADGPYINHVLRVTIRSILLGLRDPEGIIAALMHDSIEDQLQVLAKSSKSAVAAGDPERIAARAIVSLFGERVLELVGHLTIPGWQYALDVNGKNRCYVEHVEKLFNIHRSVIIIKLADFLDNACSLLELPTPDLQKRGASKYHPVYGLFITKIQTGLLPIHNPEEILAELRKGFDDATKILTPIID
jgi:(p)ppGpp synthase/HD superfamily hydrolase